jgi:hypothetical protein
MVMLICDPELTAKRILRLIRQRLLAVDDSETEDGDGRKFERVIDVLRQHGPLPALQANLITFEQLIELADNPQALRLAHNALVEWEDEEPAEPTSPVGRRFPGEHFSPEFSSGYSLSASSDDEDEDFSEEAIADQPVSGGASEKESEIESGQSGRQALPSLDLAFDWSNVTKEQFVSLCQDRKMLMVEASLIPQSSGGAEEQLLPLGSPDAIAVENGRIRIFAPTELIPAGLGRLTVVAFDRGGQAIATRSVFPTLDCRHGYWVGGVALLDLFGHDLTGTSLLTALETTVQTDFRTPEVREFVSKLLDGEQRRLAERYLDETGREA